jgi:anion transporter
MRTTQVAPLTHLHAPPAPTDWFLGFAPLGVLLTLLSYLICKPEVKESPEVVAWAASELTAMGPLSRNEWIMTARVILAMFLWITGPNPDIKLPFLGANYINATMVVVLVVISLLLVTRVIDFADIVAEKAAWEVFFYFSSLLTLSSGLNEIGFIKWVAEGFAKPLGGVSATMAIISLVCFSLYCHCASSSAVS